MGETRIDANQNRRSAQDSAEDIENVEDCISTPRLNSAAPKDHPAPTDHPAPKYHPARWLKKSNANQKGAEFLSIAPKSPLKKLSFTENNPEGKKIWRSPTNPIRVALSLPKPSLENESATAAGPTSRPLRLIGSASGICR